jgi:hypothetical protein
MTLSNDRLRELRGYYANAIINPIQNQARAMRYADCAIALDELLQARELLALYQGEADRIVDRDAAREAAAPKSADHRLREAAQAVVDVNWDKVFNLLESEPVWRGRVPIVVDDAVHALRQALTDGPAAAPTSATSAEVEAAITSLDNALWEMHSPEAHLTNPMSHYDKAAEAARARLRSLFRQQPAPDLLACAEDLLTRDTVAIGNALPVSKVKYEALRAAVERARKEKQP